MKYRLVIITIILSTSVLSATADEVVSIFELLAGNHSKNVVSTSGYLHPSADGVFLYPYQSDAENGDFTREIMVSLSVDSRSKVESSCANQYVFITGVFFNRSDSNGFSQLSDVEQVSTLKRDPKNFTRKKCL
jgi:hypothetical protein